MNIVKMQVDDLIPANYNPRKDLGKEDKEYQKLRNSIEKFGYVEPIIYNKSNNVVVGGHQRLKVLKDLGYNEIDCIVVDLDENKEKALNIALNKISGEWQFDKLKNLLEELDTGDIDIELTGFDIEELENMMTQFKDKLDGKIEEDDFDIDKELLNIKKPITKRGDIWILGKHRLMCGDSTIKVDIEKLMCGNKADITFTSPPYNVGITPKEKGKYHNNKNLDNRKQEDYTIFLDSFVENALMYSDYVFSNVQSLSGNKIALIEHLYNMRNKYADVIIWNKINGQPAMARRVLNSAFEYIYVFSNEASRAIGKKDFRGTITNIFELSPNGGKEYSDIHKATFKIELPIKFIEWFTENSILDLFGGTGTTLIASEKTNRICYMMELDEIYCDVIINRYINLKCSNEDVYLLKNDVKVPYSDIRNKNIIN